MCVHSLRELMEKLPEYLDVSTAAPKESLKSKVREVEGAFGGMSKKTKCLSVRLDGVLVPTQRTVLAQVRDLPGLVVASGGTT